MLQAVDLDHSVASREFFARKVLACFARGPIVVEPRAYRESVRIIVTPKIQSTHSLGSSRHTVRLRMSKRVTDVPGVRGLEIAGAFSHLQFIPLLHVFPLRQLNLLRDLQSLEPRLGSRTDPCAAAAFGYTRIKDPAALVRPRNRPGLAT